LPPIKNGREFDSLDTASNCKAQEKTIKVRLHRASGHFELPRDLCVVTTLEQQFRNLLLARTQPNGTLFHSDFPLIR
jgi:hypothetical protein